jgi:hypothetical protein
MRSRALPDDFDMAQALHSPFGNPPHAVGTPLTSPNTYTPTFPEGNMIRPLSIDTLRRLPEGTHMSPTGISPAFGGFAFTPPQSATDTLSPVSASPGGFEFPQMPVESPRRPSNFSGSVTTGPGYGSHPHIPRLQIQERLSRTRSESLHSPLRTSMTYEQSLNGTSEPSHPLDAAQMGAQRAEVPYGLGYSCTFSNVPVILAIADCIIDNPIPGFQAASRMRSYSGSVPRRIELSPHYTPNRNVGLSTPQTATFPNYQTSPMGAPQNFSMPHMSAPHHITSFPSSFLRQDNHQGEQYQSVGAVLGEVVDNHSQEGDETQEAAVQLSPSY